MKKRIFILTLSLIFILSAILPSVTTVVRADKVVRIKDIGSHWGKKYIDQLIARGGVNGYDDGTFRPNNPITIAEFVTMALRSALDGNVSEKVDEHWASGIFKDANEKKILLSNDFPKTEWSKPINRYEMAYIMVRLTEQLLGEVQTETTEVEKIMSDYEKVSKEKKYKYYVEQAFMKGLVTGKTADGKYDGSANGTRAEAATMIVRVLDTTIREKVDTKKEEENKEENKVLPSTIIFADSGPIAKIVKDEPFTNKVTGVGEGLVTYTSGTPATATVDKTTGEVKIVGVGTTVITATKAATKTHSAVTNTYIINVTETKLIPSTIVFEEVGPITKKLGDPVFTNKATGVGEGLVTYTSGTPATATVDKTTGEVKIVAEGTTVITATKAATKTHSEVVNTYTINVSKNDAIKLTSITNIIGEAKVGETLTAGSVIPNEATVTYAWLRIGPKMPEWEYIPGATTNKYTIAASDVDYQIRVAATGTGNYSGTVVSKGTTKVTTNVIVKEDLRVEGISARPINLGQKLVESELNVIVKNSKNETINGILNWDEPTRVLTKDESCAWTFIPTDLELYNIIQRKLIVGVISPNDFDGGDGTASRPYRVSTAEQLNNVRKYLDKHFIQTTDITLDITVWKDREGWEPIGTKDAPFTGSYDGLGYKIKELTIYGDHYYQGLFGEIGSTGQIINIALLDVKINGADYLGSLASINRGLIENCYATGSIQGWSTVGGLVGFNRGTIKRSYSTVSLKGLYQYSRFYGGLAGESTGAIEDSYATGRVVAYNNVGGLVGDNMGTLNRCYAKGYVEATTTDTSGYLHRDHGGIVGYRWDGSKVIDCYYDKETTHRSDDNGKGYPKSTKEMTESKTFKNWDSTIWTIDESVSYPYLLWQGKTNIPLK